MTIEHDLETILDEFDFYKVGKVMQHLDWKWAHCDDVPTTGEMRRWARDLLHRCATLCTPENPESGCASGGFWAQAHLYPGDTKMYLSLKFVVTQWDNYED